MLNFLKLDSCDGGMKRSLRLLEYAKTFHTTHSLTNTTENYQMNDYERFQWYVKALLVNSHRRAFLNSHSKYYCTMQYSIDEEIDIQTSWAEVEI